MCQFFIRVKTCKSFSFSFAFGCKLSSTLIDLVTDIALRKSIDVFFPTLTSRIDSLLPSRLCARLLFGDPKERECALEESFKTL